LSDTVAIAGITAAAGLGGAVVAAIAAGHRQKHELAHDRKMRDLGEIRNRLDDVMDEGEKALTDLDKANDALNAQDLDRCEAKLGQAKGRLNKVHARVRRIRLLYGDDHEGDEDLVLPLQTYLDEMEAVHAMVDTALEHSCECDEEELKRVVGQAAESQVRVIAAASRLVGARPHR
jgi:chromosome segregation ATPase